MNTPTPKPPLSSTPNPTPEERFANLALLAEAKRATIVDVSLLLIAPPEGSTFNREMEATPLAHRFVAPGAQFWRVKTEVISSEAVELPLWLDSKLSQAAMSELLIPGSNPVVVLVDVPPGSHGANQLKLAVDHLRSTKRDWLFILSRDAAGHWSLVSKA